MVAKEGSQERRSFAAQGEGSNQQVLEIMKVLKDDMA
jgi:hypothetical protein